MVDQLCSRPGVDVMIRPMKKTEKRMFSRSLVCCLIPLALVACSTQSSKVSSTDVMVAKSGPLKVHPGLLGRPVPVELQEAASPAAQEVAAAPMRMDEAGLRTQRSIYFEFDSSAIKAEFDPTLNAHARYLAANPKAKVRIEGNADERGPSGYNSSLGLKRAENVRQKIIANGAGEKQVVIRTLGESRPKLKGHDEESWAENRRADIVYEREE